MSAHPQRQLCPLANSSRLCRTALCAQLSSNPVHLAALCIYMYIHTDISVLASLYSGPSRWCIGQRRARKFRERPAVAWARTPQWTLLSLILNGLLSARAFDLLREDAFLLSLFLARSFNGLPLACCCCCGSGSSFNGLCK